LEYRLTDLIGFVVGARFTSDKKDYNFSWYPYETFPQSPTGATTTLTPTAGFALSTPYVGNRFRQSVQRQGSAGLPFIAGHVGLREL